MKFTKKDRELLESWGENEDGIAQIELATQARYTKYIFDGRQISREETIRLLGRRKYLAVLSRSAFHHTAAQPVGEDEDCGVVYFDSSRLFKEQPPVKAPKVLYFEGAGWSDADISKATIGNCRIRTAFHLDDGRAVYLEIVGSERTKHSSPRVYQWQYTGFVTDCFYITDDVPNDDCNKHRVTIPGTLLRKREAVEHNVRFEYTEAEILRFVNSLGAGFDAIKVVPDLGGYRVFPSEKSCQGPDGYYYGDEFKFDPELTARREAVYGHYYEIEKAEGTEHPNLSMWVDEHDPGLLHLLRHFSGDFKTAGNRHWLIRVDGGNTLDDILATAQEATLGKYGC